MVIKLVDIAIQKRSRGDTVRPAISIPRDIWNEFKFVYRNKSVRNNIVSEMLSKHITIEKGLK